MVLKQAVFTDQALVLQAKFRYELLWMSITKDHWKLEVFFDLLFDIFVGAKLERLIKPCWCTMIRVAERALNWPLMTNSLFSLSTISVSTHSRQEYSLQQIKLIGSLFLRLKKCLHMGH
jgi:hypothetical protein